MVDAAQAIYPNGPSQSQGNNDPYQVLSTFQGNHEGALIWGERKHQEAYVQLYGYEKSIGVINQALENNSALKGKKTGGGEWYKDLTDYRDELLSRQGY